LQTKQNIKLAKKNVKHAKLTKKAVILKMQLPVIVQILEYYKIRTNYVDEHETKTINEKSRKFIQGRQLLVLTLHFAMYNHNVTFCHN
jgi:hypothetical protein